MDNNQTQQPAGAVPTDPLDVAGAFAKAQAEIDNNSQEPAKPKEEPAPPDPDTSTSEQDDEDEDTDEPSNDGDDLPDDVAQLKQLVKQKEKGAVKAATQNKELKATLDNYNVIERVLAEGTTEQRAQVLEHFAKTYGFNLQEVLGNAAPAAKPQGALDPEEFEYDSEKKLASVVNQLVAQNDALKSQLAKVTESFSTMERERQEASALKSVATSVKQAIETQTGWKPTLEHIREAQRENPELFRADPIKAVKSHFVDEILSVAGTAKKAEPKTVPIMMDSARIQDGPAIDYNAPMGDIVAQACQKASNQLNMK